MILRIPELGNLAQQNGAKGHTKRQSMEGVLEMLTLLRTVDLS